MSEERNEKASLEMKKILDYFRIIDERIKECKLKGHLQPDEKKNECGYCFQHLVYSTPETDALLAERSKLPLIQQPYDAPFISKMQKRELESQKFFDFLNGVEKLTKDGISIN
jgi:hypothetical protein